MKIFSIILSVFCCSFYLESAGQPVFRFTQDEYDFGVAEEGENLTYNFEFTNGGTDTIQLKEETRDVRPGCSCTASEYTRTPVPPGGKGFVKAGYLTQGRIGTFQKSITISQKGKPYKTLTIKGIVVKKIEMMPAPVNPKKPPSLVIDKKDHYFGKIGNSEKVSWRFGIKNNGKDTLKISSFYSACKCTDYKLLNAKDNNPIDYVLPGKNALLEVNYQPLSPDKLSDSRTEDLITLLTNDPLNKILLIKLSADIDENINDSIPKN